MKTPVTYPVTLAAGQEKTIPISGRFLHVRTSSVGYFEAAFGDDPFQTFYPGATYPSADEFDQFRIRDSLGAGCDLVLVISESPLRDVAYDEVILSNIDTAIAGLQVVMTAIRDELQGNVAAVGYNAVAVGTAAVEIMAANTGRKGCSIQARWDNTGIIYVGFDSGVGPAAYQSCLAAGAGFVWDDYRGPIFAEASVAAQEAGWGEW